MAEQNVAEVEKVKSKTEQFKEHLQKIIYQQLGVKVSRDKAWSLFKAYTHGTVEFVISLENDKTEDGTVKGRRLPLSGLGTFEILETKPRGSKAGLDKDGNPIEGAEPWPFVPKYRFYPSAVIDNYVEYKYGLGNHTDVKETHYGIFAPDEPIEEKPAKEKKAKSDKAPKKEKKADKPADAVDDGLEEI